MSFTVLSGNEISQRFLICLVPSEFNDVLNLYCLCLLKVWAIADSKRQGFLGFREFITAMQVLPFNIVSCIYVI